MSVFRKEQRQSAIPLPALAIALGVVGLGAAWGEATRSIGAWSWIGDVLTIIGLLVWVGVLVGRRVARTPLRDLFENPAEAPALAFVPVVPLVAATHFAPVLPTPLAPVVIWVLAVGLAVTIAGLLARWLQGGFLVDDLHGGFLVPLVAGPFIAGSAFALIDEPVAGVAALGVGLFFWVVLGGALFVRYMSGVAPRPAARPAIGVLLAPPATGGVAWFALGHAVPDGLQEGLLGVFVVMLLTQLFLVWHYIRAPFSVAFWAFSFPIASSANYLLRWLRAGGPGGWQLNSWGVLTLATGAILALGVATTVRIARMVSGLRPEAPSDVAQEA